MRRLTSFKLEVREREGVLATREQKGGFMCYNKNAGLCARVVLTTTRDSHSLPNLANQAHAQVSGLPRNITRPHWLMQRIIACHATTNHHCVEFCASTFVLLLNQFYWVLTLIELMRKFYCYCYIVPDKKPKVLHNLMINHCASECISD